MRDVFKCTACGLVVQGRLVDGRVTAYDRAGAPANSPPKPFICAACVHKPALKR
jgi:hypothetical protein